MTTKAKIEAFIVTLGTMGIYRSLITYFADSGTLSLNSDIRDVYRPIYYDSILRIPIPVIVFALAALVGWVLMNRTAFGRYCMAIGSNEAVARYPAIKVDRIKNITYILQGLCVSLATIIYAAARLGLFGDGCVVGAGSHRGGDHRRHGAQGWVRAYWRHGDRGADPHRNWQYFEPYRRHLELPQRAVQGVIIIVAVYLQRSSFSARKRKTGE